MAEMSKSQSRRNDTKITRSVMQNNWRLLKKIRFSDINDTMIERSLMSIEDSAHFREKRTESKQTEALLYVVFSKPQDYLDKFFDVLAESGYGYILETLREDQASKPSENRRDEPGGQVVDVDSTINVAPLKQLMGDFEKMQAGHQQKQEESMQKKFELLKRHQSEETARQTRELKQHYDNIMLEEFAKLKHSEDEQKKMKDKIEKLESQMLTIQRKLEQERAKTDKEMRNMNGKILQLEREKDLLKKNKDQLKEELGKLEAENRDLRYLINRIHRPQYKQQTQTQNQSFLPDIQSPRKSNPTQNSPRKHEKNQKK